MRSAAVFGWGLRLGGAGLLWLRRWEMASSLLMVNPIRYQPQQFKSGLPPVPGSGLIVIPPPERKDKIKQFRMCLGNIHNPEDTKTSTNFCKGHWSLTGWIASTFCSMGSCFKEPLGRDHRNGREFRAPVSDLIYLAIAVDLIVGIYLAIAVAWVLVNKNWLNGNSTTIIPASILGYVIYKSISYVIQMPKFVKVGNWILIHRKGGNLFGRIEGIGLFSSITMRVVDGRSIVLPLDFIGEHIIDTRGVDSRVCAFLRLKISGKSNAIKRVLDQLTEMKEKLSFSRRSIDIEPSLTLSVAVVLSCYLKIDEPKDYLKLSGKLLEDILELLGPQEQVNVMGVID